MTHEQEAAHERLQAALPVKTVGEPHLTISHALKRTAKPKKPNGNVQRRRPLIFLGKRYPSIQHAHWETGYSTSLIWRYAKQFTRNSMFINDEK